MSLHACITTGQRSSSQNRYGQAVKAQFGRSKFLTAVADVSTGPIGVATPCVCDDDMTLNIINSLTTCL